MSGRQARTAKTRSQKHRSQPMVGTIWDNPFSSAALRNSWLCEPPSLPYEIFIDPRDGDDETGDGSAHQPYKTLLRALTHGAP